jgi:transposase
MIAAETAVLLGESREFGLAREAADQALAARAQALRYEQLSNCLRELAGLQAQQASSRNASWMSAVPCGILYVLHTGIHWEYQPQGLGLGSATRCWRRLRDWNEAGVWQRLHPLPKAPPMPVARCGPSGGAVGFR